MLHQASSSYRMTITESSSFIHKKSFILVLNWQPTHINEQTLQYEKGNFSSDKCLNFTNVQQKIIIHQLWYFVGCKRQTSDWYPTVQTLVNATQFGVRSKTKIELWKMKLFTEIITIMRCIEFYDLKHYSSRVQVIVSVLCIKTPSPVHVSIVHGNHKKHAW